MFFYNIWDCIEVGFIVLLLVCWAIGAIVKYFNKRNNKNKRGEL